MVRTFIAAGALALVAACGETTTTTESTAPGADPVAAETAEGADVVPNLDSGAAYPSQEGEPNQTVTPGAEGGRGSAETGATNP